MAPRQVGCGWWLPGFVAEHIHRDEYLNTTVAEIMKSPAINYEKGLLRLLDANTLKDCPYIQHQSDRQPMGERGLMKSTTRLLRMGSG